MRQQRDLGELHATTERVNGGLELHTHEFERPFLQAWFALYLESFRALLPVSWGDLALVSGRVLIF